MRGMQQASIQQVTQIALFNESVLDGSNPFDITVVDGGQPEKEDR